MKNGKLNDELIAKFTKYISQGNFTVVVCDYLGINESTYYNWIKRGKEDSLQDSETIYTKFCKSIKEAEAIAEMNHISNIVQTANDGTWQASAWYLERKHKNRWSAKQELEHSGDVKIKVGFSDD